MHAVGGGQGNSRFHHPCQHPICPFAESLAVLVRARRVLLWFGFPMSDGVVGVAVWFDPHTPGD